MAENTPISHEGDIEHQITERLSAKEAFIVGIIERIKTQTRATLLALGITAATTTASSAQEEVRFASVTDSRPTVSEIFADLPQTAEQMQEQAERSSAISEVFRLRQNGLDFYGPYLEEFSQLTPEDQYLVATAIYPENAQGGPSFPEATLSLIRNLRIPEEMIGAIIEEAKANWADEDWDTPAFQEALEELRLQWNTGAKTLWDIFTYAPETASKIYIVVLSTITQERLVDAQWRLVDAQWRLVDAQWRLVDAQWRLVDAQWRLVAIEGAIKTWEQIIDSGS